MNRDLDRIRGVLSRAVDWQFLSEHPMRTVKRAKGGDSNRVRYLTQDEGEALRRALAKREEQRRKSRASGNAWCEQRGGEGRPVWPADGFTGDLMPMVLIALNTGLRRGELFSLNWRSSVTLERALLTVEAGNAKSGKTRHIPLNAEALDVLTRWSSQHGKFGLVFPSPEGGRLTNINKSWDGIVTEADQPRSSVIHSLSSPVNPRLPSHSVIELPHTWCRTLTARMRLTPGNSTLA